VTKDKFKEYLIGAVDTIVAKTTETDFPIEDWVASLTQQLQVWSDYTYEELFE